MKIIPAIDIIDGKCVRLTKGDYSTSKVYSDNPLEMAKVFESYGVRYLHLVDLDGAKARRIVNYSVLERIAAYTNLCVDFGGGIKSVHDAKVAFECGATQITCGSMAVQQPDIFASLLTMFGTEKIILGADCNERLVAIEGWTKSSSVDAIDFVKLYEAKGIKYVVCTDIARDGMLSGPAIDLYRHLISETTVALIASGLSLYTFEVL